MSREADVCRSLVEMADTLVDDYDVVDLLTGLANRCVALLDVSAAGVMLVSPKGGLGLVASSSEAMRLLELFELQAQEGPCLDAFRAGQPVEHENLRAGSGRWPSFSAAALKAGFQSVVALPLRLRDATLGALNLLSVRQTPMVEADIIVARGVRGPRHRQHPAAPYRHRSPPPERAALRRSDQPRGDRAGQRRDRRARRYRPCRGFLPVAALRPQPQSPPYRRCRSRHRRQPGSAGMGPGAPFGPSGVIDLPTVMCTSCSLACAASLGRVSGRVTPSSTWASLMLLSGLARCGASRLTSSGS